MSRRFTGVAGLAFVAVYFGYVVMLNPPDISTSSKAAVGYWTDSGNQAQSIIAATLCGLAVVLLFGFVVGLAQRLEDGGAVAAAHGRATCWRCDSHLALGGWRRWTLVAGALLVVVMLAPLVFFGLMLFLVWTLVVSVSMLLPRSENP